MIKYLVILSLFALQWFHDFHVSHTTFHYNETTNSIEITSKVSIEDLEKSLESINSTKLNLGNKNENKSANFFIKNYFSNHLKITINGDDLNYKWVGKEISNDLHDIYLFFEILNLKSTTDIESIKIENSILLERSKKQSNIVLIELGDKKFNLNFTKDLKQKILRL